MMRKYTGALLLGAALLAGGCKGQTKEAAPAASPAVTMSEDEKAVYALGEAMGQQAGQQVKALDLKPAELETFKKGFNSALGGKAPEYPLQQYGPVLQKRAEAHATAAAAGEKSKSAAFRDQAAAEPGAVKTPSGMVFKTLTAGKGASPSATDTVRVHYTGTLTDGKVFDSSVQRGQPVEFQLNRVVPCWTEGVQRMKVGEKAKLVCPSEVAYGDRGTPDGTIPPGATLVFEVELLGIKGR
jgi:FKBP-type peptidyl-prolyl cis-trans isomerase FkpA